MYYSQSQEDYLLSKIFKEKKNGTYIEVGALDGVLYSNTKFFEDTLNWRGILIEPHPYKFEFLKQNRPNNFLFNDLISNSQEKLKFRYFIDKLSSLSGIESEDSISDFYFESIDPIYNNEPRDSVYLTPKTLTEIVKTTNFTHIDFLSLDVVGNEYEVLESWDFSIPIDLILIGQPIKNIKKNKMCNELLVKNRYKLHSKIGIHEFYILEDSISLSFLLDIKQHFIQFTNNIDLENRESLENYKNQSLYIIQPILGNFDDFHNNLLRELASFLPSEKVNICNVPFNSTYDFTLYSERVYIFTPLTYLYFISNLCDDNFYNVCNFLYNTKYIFFYYEVLTNNNLDQIGVDFRYIGHTLTDYTKVNYFKFLFFKRAGLNLLCNYRNIEYLKENGIENNVIYFPLLCFNTNNIKPQEKKVYDVLFYGNQPLDTFGQPVFIYRHKILSSFCEKADAYNVCYNISNNLYGHDKYNLLANTKIVIHIPSHEKLHTFPWAKVSELMCNKIFFIIEENEDIMRLGLEDKIAWYKHGDDIDLLEKVLYYKNNDTERDKITQFCYLYINNYNKNFINHLFFL